MGVFLRWGVFGILAVAALVYAYNASKGLTERRAPPAQVVSQPQADAVEAQNEDEYEDEYEDESEDIAPVEAREPDPALPPACEEELLVAERALKFRRDGEPLDRLLRYDRIAFQSDEKRRERLAAVATQWFEREGRDPDASALRAEVLRDCRRAESGAVSPAS